MIDDIIYEKYGYEEEDKINFMSKIFNYYVEKYHNEKEVKNLQAKLDNLVENLFNI